MGKKAKVLIGTSGWSYDHWKENFYPKKLGTSKWLGYYSKEFPTVEVNTTFYHLPLNSTIQKWHGEVPARFKFSIKASRYITHQKRLKDCAASVKLFHKVIKGLKTKNGPILFQLPPSFKMNKERLLEFISHLKEEVDYVFEFRHDSWYVEEIYEILSKHKIALCITDLTGKLTPLKVTSHFTYIRLHGPKKAYQGSYGKVKLRFWKKQIDKWLADKISVYCYFDNDEKGYAIQDAKSLKTMFSLS